MFFKGPKLKLGGVNVFRLFFRHLILLNILYET